MNKNIILYEAGPGKKDVIRPKGHKSKDVKFCIKEDKSFQKNVI